MKNIFILLFSFALLVAVGCGNQQTTGDPPSGKVEYVQAVDLQQPAVVDYTINTIHQDGVLVQTDAGNYYAASKVTPTASNQPGSIPIYLVDDADPPQDAEVPATTIAIDFVKGNWGTIATILFLLSELIAGVTRLESNSIFQLIRNWLKAAAGKG